MRKLLTAAVAATFCVLPAAVHAQYPSQRGQPRTPYGLTDFGKLHWLAGDWEGTSPDNPPLYERYTFTNDSTVDIGYYRDPGFTQSMGSSRLYLSVGRIFHTFGPNRWGAAHVDGNGIVFVPQVGSRSSLEWQYISPNEWTATQRSGVGGHEHVTVYHMKRLR